MSRAAEPFCLYRFSFPLFYNYCILINTFIYTKFLMKLSRKNQITVSLVTELLLSFNILVACGTSSVKFDITQFGASEDGNPLNTMYVQKAIDECSKNGGRVVMVPGVKSITRAIFVKRDLIFM
jgi:hypothetical protein